MKKIIMSTAIGLTFLTSPIHADISVKNETSDPIRIYLRAYNNGRPYQSMSLEAGENARLKVDRNILGLSSKEFFYDLTASKNLKDDIAPKWRLLAGDCSKLHVDHDVTVVITEVAGGVKTSCAVVKGGK